MPNEKSSQILLTGVISMATPLNFEFEKLLYMYAITRAFSKYQSKMASVTFRWV